MNDDSIVNAWNEWDPLKRVIVGTVENACVPAPEPGWEFKDLDGDFSTLYGPMPEDMKARATEEVEKFVSILESRGICEDYFPTQIKSY